LDKWKELELTIKKVTLSPHYC